MAMTLLEAAKLMTGEEKRAAVIEIFAASNDILMNVPFDDIQGNALSYTQENTPPGVGFRGVNEAFSESVGVMNPATEKLVIAGGDLDVDLAILKTMGEDVRTAHEALKLKALSHKWSERFIKGDSVTEVREFDGLQTRLTVGGSQVVDDGVASGGDALSLAKLDQLIDQVDQPTALIMNRAMRRRLSTASRATSVTGFIMWEQDQLGRPQARYGGLPILISDSNDSIYPVIDFTEANPGGGTAASTSIYCVSFREGMLQGIQNGPPDVRDIGELDTKSVKRTRIEWLCGLVLMHPRAAGRLRGIKDAAVVA